MSLRYQIFVLLTCLLIAFLGYGTYSTAKLLRTWRPDRNLILLPAENVLRILLLPVCVGLGVLSQLPYVQLGWHIDQSPAQVAIESSVGIILGCAVAFLFYLSTRWLMATNGARYYSTVLIEAVLPRNRRELGLVFLAMLPIVLLEELLFRSLLIGGLAPLVPVPVLLIGMGILFGAMHSPQGAWGMTGAGLAGVLFGGLFLWFGSLLAPIVAHYVANMVQIGVAMRVYRAEPFGRVA
ncbi:MAG: CPBP family intramembrane glutamic endopeptidase [Caldilineaceae bacterium]